MEIGKNVSNKKKFPKIIGDELFICQLYTCNSNIMLKYIWEKREKYNWKEWNRWVQLKMTITERETLIIRLNLKYVIKMRLKTKK